MTQTADFNQRLRECRIGVALIVLTILFGFGLGGVFGAFEAPLKAGLAERAGAVEDSVYGADAARMQSVLDKSWAYYKRAHLHAGGIGAAGLGMVLLLSSLRRPSAAARRATALAIGLGGLGYSLFWLLAARSAPGLGGTTAAKESLAWLAVPSSGLLLLGLVSVVSLLLFELFVRQPADRPDS